MPYRGKPVIGLTGTIGSGKTTVAKMLRDRGCCVSFSDQLARQALTDPEVRAKLIDHWGRSILDDSGAIDRKAVANIVFNFAGEREFLESITHPWIEQRRLEQFDAAPSDTAAFVIDAPLLIEAGLHEQCDAVVLVDAPRPLRVQRVAADRGWDEPELHRREQSQLPLDVKRQSADYVLVNDSDRDVLAERVQQVLDQIRTSVRS